MKHQITITVEVDEQEVLEIENRMEIYLNECAVISALQGFLLSKYENLYQFLANNEIEIKKVFEE